MTNPSPVAPTIPALHVVAAALYDPAGRVLIARRLPGTHMAGRWEFPGGKLEPGERRFAGLVRELDEELGIRVVAARPLMEIAHAYADRHVLLDVWRVVAYAGTPTAREGQELKWVAAGDLHEQDLLEADLPIVEALSA